VKKRVKKIPVTVLSGFLGSGKSSVLDHILAEGESRRIATISHKIDEVDINPEIIKGKLFSDSTKAGSADKASFDYLVIKAGALLEPSTIAATFSCSGKKGGGLKDIAKIDTMVTVVDAANFMRDFEDAASLKDVVSHLDEKDERNVAELLARQVEFCDIILVNKTDLVSHTDLQRLASILRSLNHEAKIIDICHGEVPLDKILDTGRFNFDQTFESAGWLREIRGRRLEEPESCGINSFVYRARRPFHPQRFSELLNRKCQPGNELIRSKGFFWLASRPESVGLWQQAGGTGKYSYGGMFWKAVPESKWPEDKSLLKSILENWQEPFGDMRQELAFIGHSLDCNDFIEDLDNCLLTDQELQAGEQH